MAQAIGTRGALPRLRGRGQQGISSCRLSRYLRSVSRLLSIRTSCLDRIGLASEAALHDSTGIYNPIFPV